MSIKWCLSEPRARSIRQSQSSPVVTSTMAVSNACGAAPLSAMPKFFS